MQWLADNWYVVVAGLCLLAAIVYVIVRWFRLPSEQQIANIKEWLKWAVTEAERVLGSGTGQLKLRYVYNLAVKQFPWLTQYIEFEEFSRWVDVALDWMKIQLSNNENVANYVSN